MSVVSLPTGTIACAPGGRTTGTLPEDSPELEVVESFHDFLRVAPPPIRRSTRVHESDEEYRARIGVERWVGWRYMLINDAGLRQYIAGGEWS